jgi:hypothetical protein
MGEVRDRIDRIIDAPGAKSMASVVVWDALRALADELDATQKGLVRTSEQIPPSKYGRRVKR